MNQEQLRAIFNRISYKPTEGQWSIHLAPNRLRQVAGGERSGKSQLAANDLFARMFEGKLFWICAADYERTRAEFNYIIENHVRAGIRFTATKSIDPGEINNELGITIKTKSLKDPAKIAMEAPDGIVVCEAAQIDYESYLRLRFRLAEKRAWMLLEGTFEGSTGYYVDLYNYGQTPNPDDLRSFSLPTWSNTFVFPGGINDPEIQRLRATTPEDIFNERFAGIPCPPRGLVFPEFNTSVHVVSGVDTMITTTPTEPAYLWIDPGYQHAYVVLVVQKKPTHLAIVDEVYEHGLVTEDIIRICQERSWWRRVPRIAGAIDIAARQHQAMRSPVEIWQEKGGKFLNSRQIKIVDGIERTKMALKVNPDTGKPGVLINPRCRGLISELGGCPNPLDGATRIYKWKTDSQGRVVGDTPEDKNNDACKALAYGLVDMLGFVPRLGAKPKIFKVR